MASASSAVSFRPSGDSRRVASIAIDPAISGGIGSGDTAGDRGLLVAVQPRDAARQNDRCPGRNPCYRLRSIAPRRGVPRRPLGFHPCRDRRAVLPHGRWARDPFGDGLARSSAKT